MSSIIIIRAFILAASLCADCFAVSMCSSVTVKDLGMRRVSAVAISFALIQTAFLLAGWAFGYLFVGLVEKISHLIAFLLLLYVGGEMVIEGVKALRGLEEESPRDLNGFRNILIGGIATSIDALAVGVAQSMSGADWSGVLPLLAAVFIVTASSVVAGMYSGRALGHRFGHAAEVAGGAVLIAIGVGVLL